VTKSMRKRFYEKIRLSEDTQCWQWDSAIGSRGYGLFWVGGKKRTAFAHRVSWEMHNEQIIPLGMYVMHSCDNPRCVNPTHLSIGTARDNKLDAVRKKRHAYGERNGGGGKLTEATAQRIKQRADGLSISQMALAYGICKTNVKRILSGKLWKHV
jgi:hypothetical protein